MQNFLLSKSDRILLVTLSTFWTVECTFLKPNWWLGITLQAEIELSSLSTRIVSKILEITGGKLIGLYTAGRVVSFPGLGIALIWAIFHTFGKYSNLNIELKIFLMNLIPHERSSFNNYALMRPYSGGFLHCILLIWNETSLQVWIYTKFIYMHMYYTIACL